MLTGAGQLAIGTTSAGHAFSLGLMDNKAGCDSILENAADIAEATDLLVSADLENGFGDSPESVAETISLAGELVGWSIEDSSYEDSTPLYGIAHSITELQLPLKQQGACPLTSH